MPESGQIERIGRDCVRIWYAYWQGHPPVLRMGSCLADGHLFADVPDGSIVDLQALIRGELIVLRRPPEPTKLSDDAFEAILREAEVAGRG